MKPIPMVAWFDEKGNLHPVRFYIHTSKDEQLVIPIDKVEEVRLEKYAGSRMISYRCYCLVKDTVKVYQIKYELQTCQWFLLKTSSR